MKPRLIPIIFAVSLFLPSFSLPCSYQVRIDKKQVRSIEEQRAGIFNGSQWHRHRVRKLVKSRLLQNPRVEDVLLEVPIEHDHPHRHRRGFDTSTPAPKVEKFAPLRIHLHYDKSIQNLTDEVQHFVNTTLLPEAVGYWENALRVRSMTSPIRLRRSELLQWSIRKTVFPENVCLLSTTTSREWEMSLVIRRAVRRRLVAKQTFRRVTYW